MTDGGGIGSGPAGSALGDPALGGHALGDSALGGPALGDPALSDPALSDSAPVGSALGDPAPVGSAPDAELRDRRVLVVEDDPTLAEVAIRYLRGAGFLVDHAPDGFAALATVDRARPDLVVLDRMLPGIDGIEVCRRLRATTNAPVLMLTAMSGEEDRILGLEAGADDYLTKPYSPRELVLRVTAILRRTVREFSPESPFSLGSFHLDPSARTATQNGETLALTVREFDLLAFFLKRPNQVFTRDELLRVVWGWTHGDLSTVTVHVRRLREKIEANPDTTRQLATVWGVGYRFEHPEDPVGQTDPIPTRTLS